MNEWKAYLLAAFAVFAGQVLRVGQKIEAGKPVTWRDLFVMCSLLPAFGSIAGAAAIHFNWPVWSVLVAGISAGWLGFATMRFVLVLARQVASQLSGAKPE
ncbi:hypothetical protein [Sphingomonas sp. T9W2]|uniref:hypothetical protein n=1 Tax=Sphingomonas sp. T9W2 TaxID=3143183 RepID=UPI0031F4C151